MRSLNNAQPPSSVPAKRPRPQYAIVSVAVESMLRDHNRFTTACRRRQDFAAISFWFRVWLVHVSCFVNWAFRPSPKCELHCHTQVQLIARIQSDPDHGFGLRPEQRARLLTVVACRSLESSHSRTDCTLYRIVRPMQTRGGPLRRASQRSIVLGLSPNCSANSSRRK